MKRTLAILASALLLLIISACDDSNSNSNTISVSELTDRENAILSSSSDKSLVFDFNINKEYKEVTVWIEKYEFGNLVKDKLSELTMQVEGDGSIILTTPKTNYSQNQPIFNTAISSKEGVSTRSAFDPNSDDLDDMSIVWGPFPTENTIIEGEVVLGSICYSNEGRMNSLTADFYQDVEGHINELEKYDVVYLFKADFIK
ncbi:hypothetical protein JOD29_003405 [Lysinibacillus composti]|uniref:Lipoprotein n=1 Tax=Lysinibacillus composti TaxID=720633 RepID=A0A3N9UMV8_9BACI|nr:hypothetical protein [Lysinibacillus composti]MBM7610126.1 hypothetical protein [Lysinibacillus composti]RQW73226.1 hypothetical protein EBB45_17855 [Lysinibacillus composti]